MKVVYAKSCCCFALRYGVILIAAFDIISAVYILTTTAIDMKNEKDKFHQRVNKTGEEGRHAFQGSSISNLVLQILNIFIAISLIVVAAINKTKYRKLLLVWIAWTGGAAVMLVITTIIRSATGHISWVEILIIVVIAFYMLLCIWLVTSYYKLLLMTANEAPAGYDVFANENDDELHGV